MVEKWCSPRAEDRAIFEDLRLRGQGLENVSSRPRTSSRSPPLIKMSFLQDVESRTKRSKQRIQKNRAQGPTFEGQTLSRLRTGMVEAKARYQRTKIFEKLLSANFLLFFSAKVFKILPFIKFSMIV